MDDTDFCFELVKDDQGRITLRAEKVKGRTELSRSLVSHRLSTLNGMDIQMMLKDAALWGLAIGVFVMAAVLLWGMGAYALRPATTVAAAVNKPPFGFCPS